MKKVCLILALALLLSGCTGPDAVGSTSGNGGQSIGSAGNTTSQIDTSDVFTDRDLSGDYETGKSAQIQLNGDSAVCGSNAVQISSNRVTITDEGTYILTGTLDDGMVIVSADKQDKVQLVLDGVSIHSKTSAALYILQADKVFVTLAEGSVNTLSNGGSFAAIDDNNIDGAIFSKEDLTLNGKGSLTVTSPAGHGIVSKDELTVAGGSYTVSCASHGLAGKDSVSITDAALKITAGKDGIHAENSDDASMGYLYVKSGSFDITAEGDGLSAASHLQIDEGAFQIITGGGSVNGDNQTSDSWGGFPGGGMGGRPGSGRPGGGFVGSGITSSNSDEDSTSIKGIKAGGNLTIAAGIFTIDAADDAVHSNTNLTVNGGTFQIATGDDGFHADETLTITAGTIDITESYEGLEGLHVVVSGGNIKLVASDDGLNAAGGIDQSGLGGNRGNDRFGGGMGGMGGMSGSSNGSITVSGGSLYVKASGDGMDANGTLTISGGNTVVCGPTTGDTATLDYDKNATISGGTFIGTGASGMAQTFSGSDQGVIAVQAGTRQAGTGITLQDGDGNVLISCEPELSFAVVILSCPEMVKGEKYTITIGSDSGEFAAS